MDQKTIEKEIPATGLWKDLPEGARRKLSEAGRCELVPEGTYICVQGKDHHSLAVIISGKLRVTCHAHGDTVVLAELGPGNTVGEMSLIDPRPASANVRVVEGDAEIWSIDGCDYEKFVDANLMIGYAVMKMFARELSRRLRSDAEHMLHREDEIRTKFLDMDY